VAGVILATDVLSAQPFTQQWPAARDHFEFLPLGLLGLVAVVVVLTVVVALITTGLRSRHDPAWREVLTAVGLAALAALATQGLQAQLPANVAFPVLTLVAAVAAWLAASRAAGLNLGQLRSGTSRPAMSQSPAPTGAATSPSLSRGPRSAVALAMWGVGALLVAWVIWRVNTRPTVPSAASIAPPPPAMTAPVLAIRMHGSNTIGGELAPALAEAFLQRRTAAKAIVRRRTAPDEVRVEARDGDRTIEAIEVFAHGTATGFQDLAAGSCDMAMASRRIRPDEAEKLASLGDLASAASEHVVALDGIAVIVNPSNPVSALTTGQIGDVFAGKIRRWSELGGKDDPIVVHARESGRGLKRIVQPHPQIAIEE